MPQAGCLSEGVSWTRLCVTADDDAPSGSSSAATLGDAGLEFYSGFLELKDRAAWGESRRIAADRG